MKKLIAALVAATFSLGAFAQTPAPAAAPESAAAPAHKKAAKKHKKAAKKAKQASATSAPAA